MEDGRKMMMMKRRRKRRKNTNLEWTRPPAFEYFVSIYSGEVNTQAGIREFSQSYYIHTNIYFISSSFIFDPNYWVEYKTARNKVNWIYRSF